MNIPRRIKFIWGASKVIRGIWYLGVIGLYDRRSGERDDGIAISVRGLLAWGAAMLLAGWVVLATAGFWIWQRNPHSLLTYTDALFYPLRRVEIAEKKGQAYIAQGQELARAGRWLDAVNLLRLGLARFPRDIRARLTLAQFYQLTNQNTLALKILTDGLGDDYPGRAYLDALIRLATQGEDFDAIVATSARYLPMVKKQGLTAEVLWLVEKRYAALTAAARHAEALALAEAEGGGELKDERRVLSLIALGRMDEASAQLAAWRARPGAGLKAVARLEARTWREMRRYDDMDRALDELVRLSPGEPAALVFGVVQRAMAGREAAAGATLTDFIFRFGGFADNLALAAAPLAEIGNLPLLLRCVAAARERGFPLGRFQVHLIDTHLARAEWDAARDVLNAMAPVGKDPKDVTWREWLVLAIEAGKNPGEAPQRALVEFLRGRPWTMGFFRRNIETMLHAERLETTREILDLALRAFPVSQWLQATAADVKLRLQAQAAALSADAAGAVPLPAEVAFNQRLEFLLRARNWTEAAKHISQALSQAPVPAWLEGREPAIRLAQVRIAQGQRDLPGMSTAARLFLNGSVPRANEMHDLAREFLAAGDKAAAINLAREIVRSTPGHATAQRALREWDPAERESSGTGGAPAAPAAKAEPTAPSTPEAFMEQLRARHAAGDVPGWLNAARQLLTGERARAERLVAVAREWAAAGDKSAAELLIKEIFRRHEGFPPARRLLAELNPPPPAKKQ